jgi:uncharacterized protein (DUF1330 family)
MPKGYVIARVTVTDADKYAVYAKMAGEAIRKHGGKPLVRGGKFEELEGPARARNVVIEFESFEKAKAYFHSTEYQAAKKEREGAATGEFVVVEGFEG